MTPRNTKRQRLTAAGWRHVSGWVRADLVVTENSVGVPVHTLVDALVWSLAEEAERIATTAKPSGRPKAQGQETS